MVNYNSDFVYEGKTPLDMEFDVIIPFRFRHAHSTSTWGSLTSGTHHHLHRPREPDMGDNAGLEFEDVQKSILAENLEASHH